MYTKLLRTCMFHGLSIGLFLLLICFTSLAQANDQGDRTITLSGTGITIKKIFNAIRDQAGIMVMYNQRNTLIDQQEKVNVSFKNTSVNEVLDFLFSSKGLGWTFNEDVVVIHKKKVNNTEVADTKKNLGDSSVVIPILKGTVTDASGNIIPGATVQVKGTGQGTVTDALGNFTLSEVTAQSIITITFIGYETRELIVKSKTLLAQLNPDINQLDETVVVAYSSTTKRLNTGNVTTIKSDKIGNQAVTNPMLALEGQVPGLFISQGNGMPGSAIRVQVQGQNSIGNGNDPFYVVDGVPYSSQLMDNNGGILGSFAGGKLGSPLNYINPSDIESISILKDADATAIYGSRAANGAILITTKKGKAGKMKVDVNLQQGWGTIARRLKLLNTQQYIAMRKEGINNDGKKVESFDYDINGLWDSTRYTDWQKELIGNTAHYTNVSANLSGGNNQTQYLIGTTYQRQTAVFPGDFSDRKASLHFNLTSNSVNQKIKMQLSANYMVDDNHLPKYDFTTFAARLSPNAPTAYNPDGSLNWMFNDVGAPTWTNPYSYLYQTYSNTTRNLISNAIVSYNILPGLEIKSNFGYTNMQVTDLSITTSKAISPAQTAFIQPSASYGNNNSSSWIIEPQITYQHGWGQGKLDALIGTTIQQLNNNGQLLNGSGYNDDQSLPSISSAGTVVVTSATNIQYKYNALFGRLNFNWADRYIINLTARRDGSSRFGSANRFHNFGAIGLGWIFSEERFFKNSSQVFSFGKLRGSYGTTGNDQIGDYTYLNRYIPVSVANPYQGIAAIQPISLTNPYLQWEETKKIQGGIDLGFFKDRILLTVNYAVNRSSNQLLDYRLPIVTGFPGITRNFPATVQNTNWEFSLNTTNIKRNSFTWTSSFNMTIPKNKLVSFPNFATSSYGSSLIIGEPISILKKFKYAGVDPQTGSFQFTDAKGSLTNFPVYPDDLISFNRYTQKFYGGLENNISYKGLELNFLFQFVKQDGQAYQFGKSPGRFQGGLGNQPEYVLDRWQKPGDHVGNQRFSSDYSLSYQFSSAADLSDASVGDASFIRLRNISLSWQIPGEWKQRMRLQSCRVYVSAQNLLTITSYKGIDPETQSINVLPPLRMVSTGIQLSF